jgi:hypothetical protein
MPDRNYIIIESGEHIEVYTSLLKVCESHADFTYNTIRKYSARYPFIYKGWSFYKVRLNKRHFYAKKL